MSLLHDPLCGTLQCTLQLGQPLVSRVSHEGARERCFKDGGGRRDVFLPVSFLLFLLDSCSSRWQHLFTPAAQLLLAGSPWWFCLRLQNKPHRAPSRHTSPSHAAPPSSEVWTSAPRGPSSKLLSFNNPKSSLCSLSPKGGSCFPYFLPLGHLNVFFLLLWSLVNNSTHYQFLYQLQSEQKLVWFLPPDKARLDSPLGASLHLVLMKLNKVGNSIKLVFSDKEPVVQRNW